MNRTAVAAAALLAAAPLAEVAGQPVGLPPPVNPAAPPTPLPSAPAKPRAIPHGAVLEEIAGVLRSVDQRENRLTIGTPGGVVTLAFDRNTMVYTAAGLGTVRDLRPGVQLRAGRNADMLAYWVQVRPASPSGAPASRPGQGTGPGGASGPPTEGGASAPGSTPPSPATGTVGPGQVGPSTTQPEGGTPGAPGTTPGGAGR